MQLMPPEMVPVTSSNIKAVGYRESERLLFVAFKGAPGRPDTLYRYQDVPAQRHQEFMAAGSQGRYFHQHIKDNPAYPCERIG